jgi:predicted ArsR family transcriptional regulator
MGTPINRILLQLKTSGATDTAALASALDISRQGALQHLERLIAEGLVTFVDERRGVGRPRRMWSLTDKAHARFPDSHAALTLEMLNAIASEFGVAGLDRMIARRERDSQANYTSAMRGARTLEDRLTRLTEIRTAEGYMAEWRPTGNGAYLLIENHCPICAAARACQGFCRSELAVFAAVLGPDVRIKRTEHLLAGGQRCAYLVEAGR